MPDTPRVLVTLNARVSRRAALLRRSVALRRSAEKHDDRALSLERAGDVGAAREHRAVAVDQRTQAAEDVRSRNEI
jgi:hypothetical protein